MQKQQIPKIIHLRIKLIRKDVTDQLDPEKTYRSSWSRTHPYVRDSQTTICVPRLPSPTTATLDAGTFTFTAALNAATLTNKTQCRTKKRKREKAQRTKMEVLRLSLKKIIFKEERSQGHFCHLKTLLGAPAKMLGAPSNTRRWFKFLSFWGFRFGPRLLIDKEQRILIGNAA